MREWEINVKHSYWDKNKARSANDTVHVKKKRKKIFGLDKKLKPVFKLQCIGD